MVLEHRDYDVTALGIFQESQTWQINLTSGNAYNKAFLLPHWIAEQRFEYSNIFSGLASTIKRVICRQHIAYNDQFGFFVSLWTRSGCVASHDNRFFLSTGCSSVTMHLFPQQYPGQSRNRITRTSPSCKLSNQCGICGLQLLLPNHDYFTVCIDSRAERSAN